MKTLVMWSGGIDSTYVLAKLLSDTTDEVHAHHIYLVNHEGRHVEENNAIKKLMTKLKEIRDFSFSESMIDNSRLPNPGSFDMAEVCMRAGVAVKSLYLGGWEADRWVIGTTLEENHNWTRWEWIYPLFLGAKWSPNNKIPKTEWELMPMVPKHEEMQYLDSFGLLEDTWYCRRPVKGNVCGACKTCAEVRYAILDNLPKGEIQNG